MSESLSLARIREGAMNPPAGTARQYEDMLWRQLEEANAAEARMRREAREAAMQRALDRSGIYNVGSMMLPQDLGDAAIGAAMMPGPMGWGARAVLAGLGGMTTQPSDAEGMFLPRGMVQRLLGSANPQARRLGEEGLHALDDAAGTAGGRGWQRPLTDEQRNERFMDALYDTSAFNVLPTEAGLAWALPPTRPQSYGGLFDAAQNLGPLPGARHLRRSLVDDPMLEAALPPSSRLNAGVVAMRPPAGNLLGSYNPESGLTTIHAGTPANMRDTFAHEMQHWIQHETPGRYARGTNERQVGSVNPNIWGEYLARVQAPEPSSSWTSVPGGVTFGSAERDAARQMYQNNFGEWEARLAGLYNRLGGATPEGINPLGFVLDDFVPHNAAPDFRIR